MTAASILHTWDFVLRRNFINDGFATLDLGRLPLLFIRTNVFQNSTLMKYFDVMEQKICWDGELLLTCLQLLGRL